jgi:2-keto-4-pentenoate hydratase/2-oxohepta-3-ene-1,7-dioic acid hydratase in catechol pathway
VITPSALFCVEDNYRDQPRPRRAGLALQRPEVLRPFLPGSPVEDVLITAIDPGSLVGDGSAVLCPRGCAGLDVGVTLAAVVGRGARVAGYAAALDFARPEVPATQICLARSFPTHTVISPWTVPGPSGPDELRMELEIDGRRRQESSTAQMIVKPAELVEVIARRYSLRPGDVVLTGSPAGRPGDTGDGWAGPGSRVTGRVTGAGTVSALVAAEDGPPGRRRHAPTSRPRLLLGTGTNYRDHVAEMQARPPGAPSAFPKLPGTAIGPGQPVWLGVGERHVDYEGEIAVVIGRPVRDAEPAEASAAIAGLMLANDLSHRDVPTAHIVLAKGGAGFCPLGPAVRAEGLDLDAITFTVEVNGEPRQHGDTAAMIHDFGSIVASFSRAVPLLPGDVILTGTPSGVGIGRRPPVFLRDGDEVVATSPQLGTLRTPIRQR